LAEVRRIVASSDTPAASGVTEHSKAATGEHVKSGH
jgi:hypothetical protein